MIEVFLTLFRTLEEYVPNEETRKEIYSELIPTLSLYDDDLLCKIESEDPVFSEAYAEYNQEEID